MTNKKETKAKPLDCYQCEKPSDPKLFAFCSPECKAKYNNQEPDPSTKRKTNFNGMSGEAIRQYVLKQSKVMLTDKKKLAMQLDEEWEAEKKSKLEKSDEKKSDDTIRIVVKDKETFERVKEVMLKEDEPEVERTDPQPLQTQRLL